MPRKKKPELTLQPHFATLTAYRKSLIHGCVTGQRRITEADLAGATASAEASARRESRAR